MGMFFFHLSELLLFFSIDSILGGSEKLRVGTVPNARIVLDDSIYMEVVQPPSISFTYKVRPAKNFGTSFTQQHFGIQMTLGDPYHGCAHLQNTNQVADTVVLLQRGGCSFVSKTLNAQQAGAVAVIIADNVEENDSMFVDMIDDDTSREVNIPALFLLGKDGYMIKNHLDQYPASMQYAIINIPINVTAVPIHTINKPPWTLW